MQHWICQTCGTQFPASERSPEHCPICEDERQYIGYKGQMWTTLDQLQKGGFHNEFREHERGLIGIGTAPTFAIGERALLLQHKEGNVLWDCMSLIDDATVAEVERLGGLTAIAISHPHYYSTMVEWSERLHATIYLHEDDRQWVMRPHERIVFWSGETLPLKEGVTLLRLGGHFSGGTVLHWAGGADGKGVLLSGDIIQVVSDRRWVSFMYSYPNLIPLPAASVQRIRDTIEPWPFERLYGAWFEREVAQDAHAAVLRSAERYIRALEAQDR
ncbi:MAG TPA: MBL fold metallo-hydrolase [Ktedonobacteraceae bacterium]|nr:MBL fold metallo-hydrolase [Ktedonobacteraceae bacterium]